MSSFEYEPLPKYFIYSLDLIFEISYVAKNGNNLLSLDLIFEISYANGKNLLGGIKNANSNATSNRCEHQFHQFIGRHYTIIPTFDL